MSQENVETVRRMLSAFGETQQPQPETFAPDFVWNLSSFQGWPGRHEFTGIDEFNEFFASWIEPYSEWVQEIVRVEDAGRNQVVATMRQRARLRDSGSWVDLNYALLFTLREGVIQRSQLFTPPEDALKAAGLSE
jgi:ketosteroid isomerase-like protein